MGGWYALVLDESATPRLWGIGVFGTSMRVYCGDLQTLEVEPQLVPRPQPTTRILPPSFLAGEWNVDILSLDGFDKMKEIMADIVAYISLKQSPPTFFSPRSCTGSRYSLKVSS